jgi:micrococcal nuclease
MALAPAYEYLAHVVDVYDGDSFKATIDLGFTVGLGRRSIPTSCRLSGIDTPELRRGSDLHKQAGKVVGDHVRALMVGQTVLMKTYVPDPGDKYGRWLADVWVETDADEVLHVNEELIAMGYAHAYDGGTKPEWTDAELTAIVASFEPPK